MTYLSKIFLSEDSWTKPIENINYLYDYEMLRWAGEDSINERVDIFLKRLSNYPSITNLVDLGCGTGNLLESWLEISANKTAIGIDINEYHLKRAHNRLAKNSKIQQSQYALSNKSIISLSDQISDVNLDRTCVSLIGVLQNCMGNPFDLVHSIFTDFKPKFIFITCKATNSIAELKLFDPVNCQYSLLYIPEIIEKFKQLGYIVSYHNSFSLSQQIPTQNHVFFFTHKHNL